MKKSLRQAVSLSLCVSMLAYPLLFTPKAFADAQLREVSQQETSKDETAAPEKPLTFKQRLEAKQAAEVAVSHIPKGEAYIPGGTQLNLELVEGLSSKTNHPGDNVKFKMLDNLIVNDVIVVPAGATAYGKVTTVTSSGLFGRAGKLIFTIDSVKAVNGVEIPLQYMGKIEAGSDGGAVAVVAVVSIVGGLFMKGKNVNIPAGTKLAAKVKNDTDLQASLAQLPEVMNPQKPHGVSITIK